MKRGDTVRFVSHEAFGKYPEYEARTGIILKSWVSPTYGRTRHSIYWSNGTTASEWEMYLRKVTDDKKNS